MISFYPNHLFKGFFSTDSHILRLAMKASTCEFCGNPKQPITLHSASALTGLSGCLKLTAGESPQAEHWWEPPSLLAPVHL